MGHKVKSRQLRPVVAVRRGVVEAAFPGCGLPVVVDLDEAPVLFAVGVDDAEIVDTVEDLATALEVAREAMAKGAWKVDLEVFKEEDGTILELHVLYEKEEV